MITKHFYWRFRATVQHTHSAEPACSRTIYLGNALREEAYIKPDLMSVLALAQHSYDIKAYVDLERLSQ